MTHSSWTLLLLSLFIFSVLAQETKVELSEFNPTLHRDMREKFLLALAAHCEPKVLKPWNCFWCKKTKPVKYVTHFDFKDSLAFGFIAQTATHIILVFRGTRHLHIPGWVSNINAFRVNYPHAPKASVHKGFWNSYKEVHTKVYNTIKSLPSNKKIWIIGHSRGGALGLLSAVELSRLGLKNRIELMTFGKPRVGNKEFSNYVKKTVQQHYRVVNKKDIVSRIPPRFTGYYHSPQEIWFPTNGTSYRMCSKTEGEDKSCSLSAAIPSIKDHLNYVGLNAPDGHKHGCL
eukprot:gene10684-3305_t